MSANVDIGLLLIKVSNEQWVPAGKAAGMWCWRPSPPLPAVLESRLKTEYSYTYTPALSLHGWYTVNLTIPNMMTSKTLRAAMAAWRPVFGGAAMMMMMQQPRSDPVRGYLRMDAGPAGRQLWTRSTWPTPPITSFWVLRYRTWDHGFAFYCGETIAWTQKHQAEGGINTVTITQACS